jgi:hypothetical protein
LSGHDVDILMVLNFSEIEKGISCTHAENPFSRSYDRKAICNSRVSFLMLRQAHSFPYKGDLYISVLNSGSKTNDIFHVFKNKNKRFDSFYSFLITIYHLYTKKTVNYPNAQFRTPLMADLIIQSHTFALLK